MTSDKKIEDEVQADASAGVTNSTVPTASDVTSEPSPSMPAPDNDEITRLKAEAADLKDRLLRAHAEMDNVRKRLEREKTDTAKFAITKFAKDVVGIGDNVQRAIDAVPHRQVEQDAALKSFVEGVTMIERELLAVLGRHGITKLDPKGEPFNPHHHQAVVEVPSAEVPAGSVTQVFQAGYMIEERVLRPAMVAVSKGGAKVPSPAEETPCDAGTPPVADDSAPGGASGSA
jgi:molecular chaperone GrpE